MTAINNKHTVHIILDGKKNSMRILLAEDDKHLGRVVKKMLEDEKIEVDWVQQGDFALEYVNQSIYDVIILDWLMPVLSGIQVCIQLRKDGYKGGIIMLTAKDALNDKVKGLEAGADDYVVKPFEFKELLARVRAVERRSEAAIKEDVITVADCELNRSKHTVKRAGRYIQLSSKEYSLLELLMKHPTQLLPRDVILNRVWGMENEVTSNNLDAHVRLLRKKLNLQGEEPLIHNVRGVGYKLFNKDFH